MKILKMMVPMILVTISITAINYYYYDKIKTELIIERELSNTFKGQAEQMIVLVKKTNKLIDKQRTRNLELINENVEMQGMIIKSTSLIQEMSVVLDDCK